MKVKPTEDDHTGGTEGSRGDGAPRQPVRTDGGERPDASRTSPELRSDGGEDARMFDDSEFTEVTLGQRLSETFQESVVTPAKIAWDDWRTKIGLTIIVLFTLSSLVTALHQNGITILNDVLGVLGVQWELHEPVQNIELMRERNRTPVSPFELWEYPLGTDGNGRDLLSAILWATPFMFKMIFAGAVFSITMAAAVGTLAGYKGGRTETVLMTGSDIALSIPGLPLVIVLVTIIQPESPLAIGILITINVWAGLARTVHSQVLSLREHSYVEASRTMGISTPQIIRKDILPNLMPYILINFTYSARRVIYDSVALYYLGVIDPPAGGVPVNWGVMMEQARNLFSAVSNPDHFFMIAVPMMPIILVSLGLILFAQGTDRLFNPRVRTRHEGRTESDDHEDDGDDIQIGI